MKMTVADVTMEIDVTTNAVFVDGKFAGSVVRCEGDNVVFFLSSMPEAQRREIGATGWMSTKYTPSTEAQQAIANEYRTKTTYWDEVYIESAAERAEFEDDQNPYSFLTKRTINDSRSDDIEETNRIGAN